MAHMAGRCYDYVALHARFCRVMMPNLSGLTNLSEVVRLRGGPALEARLLKLSSNRAELLTFARVGSYGMVKMPGRSRSFCSLVSRRPEYILIQSPTQPDHPWVLDGQRVVALVPSSTESESLACALGDLVEAPEEAEEEGFPAPSNRALSNARKLLYRMHAILPKRFEVYPTPDGEIAIDVPRGSSTSVLVLCDSDGGALCIVYSRGKDHLVRHASADLLPDALLVKCLTDLAQEGKLGL